MTNAEFNRIAGIFEGFANTHFPDMRVVLITVDPEGATHVADNCGGKIQAILQSCRDAYATGDLDIGKAIKPS
jgi:hypothetical protein